MLEYIHIRAESNETCLCQEATMVCFQNKSNNKKDFEFFFDV